MNNYQILDITIEIWGIVFCVLAALSTYISGFRTDQEHKLNRIELIEACLLAADVFAWIYRGGDTTVSFYIVRVAHYIAYILSYVLLTAFTEYTMCFLGKEAKKKTILWISASISIAGVLVTLSNLFTGWVFYFNENNVYRSGIGFHLCMLLGLLGLAVNFTAVIIYRSHMTKGRLYSFFCYMLIPAICMLFQVNTNIVSLANISYSFVIMISFFLTNVERGQMMVEQERQMNEMQKKLMLSQIQPHFIFNSLSAIYYLTKKDPQMAQDAIGQFADFLRTNLDSLNNNHPVPLEQELHHVENYLMLEKLRFGDDLNLVYDIQVTDFNVPSLSIQPIVENAVKHGVCKKIDGGTVWISTSEDENAYYVRVEDDGIGFDMEVFPQDGMTHIGIENVRNRIETMVNGNLHIESAIGKGTKALITIPK